MDDTYIIFQGETPFYSQSFPTGLYSICVELPSGNISAGDIMVQTSGSAYLFISSKSSSTNGSCFPQDVNIREQQTNLMRLNTLSQGEQMSSDKRLNTPMNSLIASLIVDALDIMPEEWAKELTPENSIDALINLHKSVITTQVKTLHYHFDLSVFSKLAYTVAQSLFSDLPESFTIPDTVYYENIDKKELDKNQTFLDKSDFDKKYSLAISEILSLWIEIFHEKGIYQSKMPSEGIYLRDDTTTLYLYAESE